MKFHGCSQVVKNLDECVKFYEDIMGLEVKARFRVGDTMEIALFESGGAELELLSDPTLGNADAGDAVAWGFEVPSMEDALKMVTERGVPVHSGPFIHPDVKYFFVQDPNGLKVELKEFVK